MLQRLRQSRFYKSKATFNIFNIYIDTSTVLQKTEVQDIANEENEKVFSKDKEDCKDFTQDNQELPTEEGTHFHDISSQTYCFNEELVKQNEEILSEASALVEWKKKQDNNKDQNERKGNFSLFFIASI